MKYSLTTETQIVGAYTLYRIRAEVDIPSAGVTKGALGGWIVSERNLSHEESSWIYGDAKVFGNARVYGDAWVSGEEKVYGNAEVYGEGDHGLNFNVESS